MEAETLQSSEVVNQSLHRSDKWMMEHPLLLKLRTQYIVGKGLDLS